MPVSTTVAYYWQHFQLEEYLVFRKQLGAVMTHLIPRTVYFPRIASSVP